MAQAKLVIGNKNYSSWSLRPWLLLAHHGVAFDEVRIPLYQADTEAALRQHSPSLKVPVLWDGELCVWDSLAICEYASERWLDGKGWPSDLAVRAKARAVTAEMHSGFTELRSHWPMNVRRQRAGKVEPGVARDIARIQQLWQQCLQASGGPFLFGTFSIADCFYAPVVLRFYSYLAVLEPACEGYVKRVLALPAMQAWMSAARAETEAMASTDNI